LLYTSQKTCVGHGSTVEYVFSALDTSLLSVSCQVEPVEYEHRQNATRLVISNGIWV